MLDSHLKGSWAPDVRNKEEDQLKAQNSGRRCMTMHRACRVYGLGIIGFRD